MSAETRALLAQTIMDLDKAIQKTPDHGPRDVRSRLIEARNIVAWCYRNGGGS